MWNVRKIIAVLYITNLSALWWIFIQGPKHAAIQIQNTKNSCDWRLLSFLWISSSESDVTLLTQQQDRQRTYNLKMRRVPVTIVAMDRQYLLTARGRVLLGKLTGPQLAKKFPAFYGNRRFITAFTSARHLSLSRASSIQSIPAHPTSWRSILILYSHLLLGLSSGLFGKAVSIHMCVSL
jgi:hypothetical protein